MLLTLPKWVTAYVGPSEAVPLGYLVYLLRATYLANWIIKGNQDCIFANIKYLRRPPLLWGGGLFQALHYMT